MALKITQVSPVPCIWQMTVILESSPLILFLGLLLPCEHILEVLWNLDSFEGFIFQDKNQSILVLVMVGSYETVCARLQR